MDFYKKQYHILFGRVDDALAELDKALPEKGTSDLLGIYRARKMLKDALLDAENACVETVATETRVSEAMELFGEMLRMTDKMSDAEAAEWRHELELFEKVLKGRETQAEK